MDKQLKLDQQERKEKAFVQKLILIVKSKFQHLLNYLKSTFQNLHVKRLIGQLKKRKEMQKLQDNIIKRNFKDGSSFMYLGKEYKLKIIYEKDVKQIALKLKKNGRKENNQTEETYFEIVVNCFDEDKMRLAFEKWYRERTLAIVSERIKYYENNFKDKISNIKVKEQKRRWASINIKNEVFFNWRISMAPCTLR
eukprot:TRINITY_DN14483_c0_g2_i1.p2 TRINITY_DN14483_c0_g2~~TRINITY_DN14483_c0_g2_i1.p2  ORF type:complete len:195 (-),score=25.06 TRINITY_DN14483_c0_g2_i1:3-587(-)